MQNRLHIHAKRWSITASVFAIALVMGTLPLSGYAQSADTDARLSRMERDIETLSRSVYKGEKPAAGAMPGGGVDTNMAAMQSQMDDRLNRLEEEIRDLTGKIEEQGNTLNQLKIQSDKNMTDLQTRMNTVEQKLGLGSATVNAGMPSSTPASAMSSSSSAAATPATGMPPAPAATAAASTDTAKPATPEDGVPAGQLKLPPGSNEPAPANSPTVKPLGDLKNTADTGAPVVPTDDPTQAYENAITLLKQRDYAVAEKTLQSFLKANPSHALTPNAKYWLGEAYFAQNKYEQAARVFAEGYQQYPKGPKAADNLLKLGLSLSAMNKNADACVALQQIGKDFPSGASAVNTRAVQEIKRLKCGA